MTAIRDTSGKAGPVTASTRSTRQLPASPPAKVTKIGFCSNYDTLFYVIKKVVEPWRTCWYPDYVTNSGKQALSILSVFSTSNPPQSHVEVVWHPVLEPNWGRT